MRVNLHSQILKQSPNTFAYGLVMDSIVFGRPLRFCAFPFSSFWESLVFNYMHCAGVMRRHLSVDCPRLWFTASTFSPETACLAHPIARNGKRRGKSTVSSNYKMETPTTSEILRVEGRGVMLHY